MNEITFNLFKYKFVAGNEITFMYNNKKVSEAYWVDILAKVATNEVDEQDLLHDVLNAPQIIEINHIPSTFNLFFDNIAMLMRSIKPNSLSKEQIDKVMKIIKIIRNYFVDYSGLHILS